APLVRNLEGDAVGVVIRAIDRDYDPAIEPGQEQLRGLQRSRNEYVAWDAGLGGRRTDRGGEVARRRASHRRERPLPGLGDRDGDRAVLERVRRIDRVILDPNFAAAERIFEVPGPPQRRVARREIDNRV